MGEIIRHFEIYLKELIENKHFKTDQQIVDYIQNLLNEVDFDKQFLIASNGKTDGYIRFDSYPKYEDNLLRTLLSIAIIQNKQSNPSVFVLNFVEQFLSK